jgi:YidC/Oxa1 family membrane protein insertase
MQKQQPNDARSRLISMLIMYVVITWVWFAFIFPRMNPPAPAETVKVLEQAQKLEKDGRTESTAVSRTQRIETLKKAAEAYDRYYQSDKKSEAGQKARFQEVNVYDYLARLEPTNEHWYSQAEAKLKEMENDFHGKSGTVELEVNGVKEIRKGDLGQIATDRLNQIRLDRSTKVYAGHLTYKILDFLVGLTGQVPSFSYTLALLFVVVLLKGISYPFQKKQYAYQRDMMRVQPLIKEMQEKMKDRPQEEVNRRMFQIYKENNVNIAAGCLPMIVMMVVIFPVFWMVRDYEYQFTHATFLWIGSEFSKNVGWLADNLAQFDVPLFIIYLVSTLVYSLMQPKPADPQQAQQQKMMMYMMPAVFGFMMWQYKWSSAFMLYWLMLNLVSMAQSWKLNREFGLGGSGGSGGTPVAATAPDEPLKPMKGVHTEKAPSGSRRRDAASVPGRIQPRRSGKRG